MAALARSALLLLALAVASRAQIPSLGWCPEYVPMADFSMERYLGTWYEAERYFSVLEAGSRCVSTNYTKAVDGRVLVSNQITNRLTGIKRVVEGEIRNVVKGAESKLNIKYSTLPVPFETTYSVLDTDYDSYAVVWSCSSIGPLRTQNSWVMTRERLAPGTVLQMAYNVLDKYKISRTFFTKTDQADCAIAEAAAEAEQRRQEAASQEKSAAPVVDAVPKPVIPVVPAIPVIPVIPVVPAVKSDIPIAPVEQSQIPVAAADPVTPVQPAEPAIPVAPVVPAIPVVPAAPVAEQPNAVKAVQPEVPLPIAVANAAAAIPAPIPVAMPAAIPAAIPATIPAAIPASIAQQPIAPAVEVSANKARYAH